MSTRFTTALAGGVASLALAGLAGWVFDVALLRSFGGVSTMKPNTGLALLFLAGALVALARNRQQAVVGFALVPLVIGVGSALGSWLGWGDGFDTFWWRSPLPQRMSVGTALGLVCLSMGVMVAGPKRPRLLLAQGFACGALGVSLVGLIGYSLGLHSLGVGVWSTMALPTSFALALAGLGLVWVTRAGPLRARCWVRAWRQRWVDASRCSSSSCPGSARWCWCTSVAP